METKDFPDHPIRDLDNRAVCAYVQPAGKSWKERFWLTEGDWIVTDEDGVRSVVKSDVFGKTFIEIKE